MYLVGLLLSQPSNELFCDSGKGMEVLIGKLEKGRCVSLFVGGGSFLSLSLSWSLV